MHDDFENIIETGEFKKTKKRKGKPKGSNFERKLAKELNSRFDTKEFARTPGSGAFATTHKNLPSHLQVQGDLITPKDFRFIIEAKCGYDININSVFSKKSELWKFIKQSIKEGKEAKKEWILIYKKDYCDPIAVLDQRVMKNVEVHQHNYFIINNLYYCLPLKELLQFSNDFFYSK